LRGLKENVIMGRLVPAGTGLDQYKGMGVQVAIPEGELPAPIVDTVGAVFVDDPASPSPLEAETGVIEG
jgi:DNA-directed RNA polymerase subunit beta'